MKNQKYKICQSCSMPLNKDLGKGGTESDGFKNNMYCSFCYVKGKFNRPEIDTPEKMQEMCIKMMTKGKMPKWIAWVFTRGIPNLERWNKNKKSDSHDKYIGIGVALGIAFGTVYGSITGDTSIGIAIGLGVGIAIGTAMDNKENKKW